MRPNSDPAVPGGLRKIWVQYTFSPVARVSLPAAGLLLCLYLLTGRAAWYGGTILLLCAAAALERALPRGRPARLSKALTKHFYAVYNPLAGRWCVSERRPGRSPGIAKRLCGRC